MSEMVLVPKEASDAIMDAMFDAARQRERHIDGGIGYVQLRAAWDAAMIAASPSSPPVGEGVREKVLKVLTDSLDAELAGPREDRAEVVGIEEAADAIIALLNQTEER